MIWIPHGFDEDLSYTVMIFILGFVTVDKVSNIVQPHLEALNQADEQICSVCKGTTFWLCVTGLPHWISHCPTA